MLPLAVVAKPVVRYQRVKWTPDSGQSFKLLSSMRVNEMSEGKKRQVHSPEFKAKVGLEALREVKTINEIGQEYGVHPVQVLYIQIFSGLHQIVWVEFI